MTVSVEALLRKPSGFLPLAMSSAALLLLLLYVATVGVEPQPDEGAAAHLWQLLMAGQLPLIVYFCIRWVAPAPQQGLIVLGTQLAAAFVAAVPVFVLGF